MWKHAVILSSAVLAALMAIGALSLLDKHETRPAAVQASDVVALQEPATPSGHATVAEVSKSADGHFWAEASVDGRHVRFLVDTGATAVALTVEDAQRLGVDPGALQFDETVTTASGPSRAARVELDYVSVAGARVDHVPALVLERGLTTSLLGMTYLGRLSRFEATQSALILRP